jgi:hypothetical protein
MSRKNKFAWSDLFGRDPHFSCHQIDVSHDNVDLSEILGSGEVQK